MTNTFLTKAAIAQAALEHVPPLIRRSLLSEQSFLENYGFKTKTKITFGAKSVSFQRSELFDAVRTVLAGADKSEVSDDEGRGWTLRKDSSEDGLATLVLLTAGQRQTLPDFSVLSENASIRIRSLKKASSDVNLPLDAIEKWRNILTERALEDDEFDTFHSDLSDTPVYRERSIHLEIKAGESSISSLVPNSRKYFERLVGIYDGSASITDYAAGSARIFFQQLAAWQPYEGFLYSLLLSSHSALTMEIGVDKLDSEELVQAYGFIENYGDTLSLIGALEIGLRVLPERPEVEPFLLRLVNRIRDDNLEGNASEINLFSALFVLVDGELSRTRLMANDPPFYRRLASLAQAALLHRQLARCDIDYESFSGWAFSNRGEPYYMQSLADMRIEPRWNPDLATAQQLKADYFGRIIIAGKAFEKNVIAGKLHEAIIGEGPQSLYKLCEFPRPFFPGPLEGAEDSPNTLPDFLAREIEQQLDTEEVKATSFIALLNSAIIFKISSDYAELAAKALRLGNYTLANLENQSQLVAILNGLATVAAISRNHSLADELRILVRRYLRDPQYNLSVLMAMNICLVAAASRKDLKEWRDFAGEWLTELAFNEFEENEGQILHSHLKVLLQVVPELWVSCARADAALEAFNACRDQHPVGGSMK